jgi:hypothetical protein
LRQPADRRAFCLCRSCASPSLFGKRQARPTCTIHSASPSNDRSINTGLIGAAWPEFGERRELLMKNRPPSLLEAGGGRPMKPGN